MPPIDWLRMRYNLWIYLRLILIQLRTVVEYRADFWIGIVGAMLTHGAGLVFIAAFFGRIPAVAGWTVWEVALLYGLTMMAYGLQEMLCDGPWTLQTQINRGEFDRVLLRPVSPALQTATAMASVHGVGDFFLGLGVFLTAGRRIELDWTIDKVLWVLLTVVCGFVVLSALAFLANMIGFWEPGTQTAFPFMIFNLAEFAKFPLVLYGWPLRFLVTAILPYGFISYYPALVLLDKDHTYRWLGYLTPLVPIILIIVTRWFWSKGLARYQGAGH